MESWVIDVTGNDVNRAKAIIRTRTNRFDLRFVVRELPDTRSSEEKEHDKKSILLWTLNGFVHRVARFDLPLRQNVVEDYGDYSDEDEEEF
jgi:hypothetical protein